MSTLEVLFWLAVVFVFATDGSAEVSRIINHPTLMTGPLGLERARQRVKEYSWAQTIAHRIIPPAERLRSQTLPSFDKAWWEQARTKPWQDIYPEVNYHTMSAVSEPVRLALDAAIAYSVTGDRQYARLVRKVLLHYTSYDFFVVHPDCGLNWSVWCSQALQAYDLIWDTLSDADRVKLDDFFSRAFHAIKQNDDWWLRDMMGSLYNNHFAWHKLFIATYGLFYGKSDLVDYAIESDQGVRDLIEKGVRDDGLWLESSLNYHFTALAALTKLAAHMRNSGYKLDLWHHRFANGRRLRDLIFGPIQTLYPDGTIPTIGDTYGRRVKLSDFDLYYSAYDTYKDPELAWLLSANTNVPSEVLFLGTVPDWLIEQDSSGLIPSTKPNSKTRLWPEHGYVALRSDEGEGYWSGHGFSCFLSFGADGIHSHRDKFNLTAFARGAHVAVDAEALTSAGHSFSSPIQGELNRSTVCHNTPMVDGQDHQITGRKLELIEFVDGSDVKMATIADLQGLVYPGVRIMRTVALTKDFLLDVFQAKSDTLHTYDYLFHTYSDVGAFSLESFDGECRSVDLGKKAPWKWLSDAKAASTSADWSVLAVQHGVNLRFAMMGSPETQVILCSFPRDDRFSPPPIPMLAARRTVKSTTYIATMQADRGQLAPIQVSVFPERHAWFRVCVRLGDKEWEFTIRKLE